MLGVFERRDVTGGLVEQEVDLLGRTDRFTVQCYAIPLQIHPMIGRLNEFAIHPDATGANPLAGFRTGTQASF